MGPDAAHEEGVGQIPPQGGPQADGEATTERMVRRMGLPPTGGYDIRDGLKGGGELCLPPPELNHTVYYDQANYGPLSGGETEAGAKGGNEMMGAGGFGVGVDADGGPGGITDGGGGGDRR